MKWLVLKLLPVILTVLTFLSTAEALPDKPDTVEIQKNCTTPLVNTLPAACFSVAQFQEQPVTQAEENNNDKFYYKNIIVYIP